MLTQYPQAITPQFTGYTLPEPELEPPTYNQVGANATTAWRNFIFDQPAQFPPDVNFGVPQDTVEAIHAFGNQMA